MSVWVVWRVCACLRVGENRITLLLSSAVRDGSYTPHVVAAKINHCMSPKLCVSLCVYAYIKCTTTRQLGMSQQTTLEVPNPLLVYLFL